MRAVIRLPDAPPWRGLATPGSGGLEKPSVLTRSEHLACPLIRIPPSAPGEQGAAGAPGARVARSPKLRATFVPHKLGVAAQAPAAEAVTESDAAIIPAAARTAMSILALR
jgi:hypothetical protein